MRNKYLALVISLIKWNLAAIVVVILILLVYIYLPVAFSPESEYLGTVRVALTEVRIEKHWQQNQHVYTELVLHSAAGLRVQALIRRPASASRPLPVVILLGGAGTGRNACGLIAMDAQVICASIDYPYYGDREIKLAGFLYNLHEIQQAVKDTPAALLLLMEYVLRQSYSDVRQVELVGVSLGAYFISVPAVLDRRVTRVWIVQGAAEPIEVIRHNYFKNIESAVAKDLLAYLLGYALGSQHLAPEKWVGRIAPCPVVFINSEQDEALPRSSVSRMHTAAAQPRQIIWIKGEHVTHERMDIIEQLSKLVIKRIAAGNE